MTWLAGADGCPRGCVRVALELPFWRAHEPSAHADRISRAMLSMSPAEWC